MKNVFIQGNLILLWTFNSGFVGPGPPYTGEIWKRSFISTVRPTRSTLIRHENGAFQKRFSNRKNLKTSAFRFRAVFIWVSKSNWFCVYYATRLVQKTRATFFIQSGVKPKPIVIHSYAFSRALRQLLRVLIGSLDYLCPLWLARVITLVLVLRHSVENRSSVDGKHCEN